jgi:hypothetical protein
MERGSVSHVRCDFYSPRRIIVVVVVVVVVVDQGQCSQDYAHSTCSISVRFDKLFPRTRLMRMGLSARDSATVHSIWTMAPSNAEFESVTVSPAAGDVTVKTFCAWARKTSRESMESNNIAAMLASRR